MLNSVSFGRVFCGKRFDDEYSSVVSYRSERQPAGNSLRVINSPSGKVEPGRPSIQKNLEFLCSGFVHKTPAEVSNWLKQFDTSEDRILALKILKKFTYIDVKNARKGYRKLYQELIKDGLDVEKTNFATLGNAKSASMMSYLFRQANKMRYKGCVQHENTDTSGLPKRDKFIAYKDMQDVELNKNFAKQGIENLVIIDDMIGDGDSLAEFLDDKTIKSLSQYKNIYYLTLIKDADGEKRIKESFPDLNIKFLAAKEVHKYDSPENTDFTPEEKRKIAKLIEKYNQKIAPELSKKYSHSKLFVAFDWNCPGNTPMMFNITNDNWNSLFERFNGLEKTDVGTNFDFRC